MEGNSHRFVAYLIRYTHYRKTFQIKLLDRRPNKKVNFIARKTFLRREVTEKIDKV